MLLPRSDAPLVRRGVTSNLAARGHIEFAAADSVRHLVVEPAEESRADEARDRIKDRKKDKRLNRASRMPMYQRNEREKHPEDRRRNRVDHCDHLRGLENLERLDFMHRNTPFSGL